MVFYGNMSGIYLKLAGPQRVEQLNQLTKYARDFPGDSPFGL